MRTDFLVVGAGPTGIGAALNLALRGQRFLLVDSASGPGGLASSVKDARGFTWDMGGHVQFSHYELFDRYRDLALGKEGWLYHSRQSWIWILDRFVAYPIQNNLHQLPECERELCIEGLRERGDQSGRRPGNFLDWIHSTFGIGIADIFMKPYNSKVWAHPLQSMGWQWVGERIALPDLATIEGATRSGDNRPGWGPNSAFRFPRHGGTGAIWRALADGLPVSNVRFSDGVVGLDPRLRRVRLRSGQEISYEHLISTMPLDLLSVSHSCSTGCRR